MQGSALKLWCGGSQEQFLNSHIMLITLQSSRAGANFFIYTYLFIYSLKNRTAFGAVLFGTKGTSKRWWNLFQGPFNTMHHYLNSKLNAQLASYNSESKPTSSDNKRFAKMRQTKMQEKMKQALQAHKSNTQPQLRSSLSSQQACVPLALKLER